jgi:hypothetical protein
VLSEGAAGGATTKRIEIAVRTGSATVTNGSQNVSIAQRQMVVITGNDAIPVPIAANWQIVNDPEWGSVRSTESTSNGDLDWQVYTRDGSPDMKPAEKNGRAVVVLGCSPERPDNCKNEKQLQVLRLQRSGLQVHDFAIGVEQYVDADVSEFTSLRLTAWVRLLAQQSSTAVAASASCPIKFQLVYKFISPADQQQERTICLYPTTGKTVAQQETGDTLYRALPLYRWYKLDLDLREDEYLKTARYIQVLRIEADGVNYLAEVTNLSLTGRQ